MAFADFQTVVGGVTAILSFLSILGSLWIIRSAIKQRRKDKHNRKFLVNEYVYYMSYCDLLSQVLTFIYFGSIAVPHKWRIVAGIGPVPCKILGFLFQFSLVASATWSFAIAIVLYRLMSGISADTIANDMITICNIRIQWHHALIWMWSIILTLIPITDYGKTANLLLVEKYECWIIDEKYQYALYIPVLCYLLLTCFILFSVFRKVCKNHKMFRKETNDVTDSYVRLGDTENIQTSEQVVGIKVERKMIAYTILFWFIWLFPCINRLRGEKSPDWLKALHHILLSCIGLGNFIIWQFLFKITNSEQEEIQQTNSFEKLVDAQQSNDEIC
eukprot:163014_1